MSATHSVVQTSTITQVGTFTVATAPNPALTKGGMIYVSNGAAGNPILAFSDGTNWLRCDTAAAIAAS